MYLIILVTQIQLRDTNRSTRSLVTLAMRNQSSKIITVRIIWVGRDPKSSSHPTPLHGAINLRRLSLLCWCSEALWRYNGFFPLLPNTDEMDNLNSCNLFYKCFGEHCLRNVEYYMFYLSSGSQVCTQQNCSEIVILSKSILLDMLTCISILISNLLTQSPQTALLFSVNDFLYHYLWKLTVLLPYYHIGQI